MLKRILVILALTLSIFSTASAEEFTIEADGYHTLSRKETILEAEEAAVNDALRWAVEQIGVRISAYSEVVNKVLKEDTVQRFASSVVKIREKTLTPKVMNDDYRIYAHVVCVVNTDDLDRWEPPDVERQRRLEEDKKRLEEDNKRLARESKNVLSHNEAQSIRRDFEQAKKNGMAEEFYSNYTKGTLEKYNKDGKAYEIAGDILMDLGHYDLAEIKYGIAMELGVMSSDICKKKADIIMVLGCPPLTIETGKLHRHPNWYSKDITEEAVALYEKHNLQWSDYDTKLKLAACYWNLERYDKFYDLLYSLKDRFKWFSEIDKWLTPNKKPRHDKKIDSGFYVMHINENGGVPTKFYDKIAPEVVIDFDKGVYYLDGVSHDLFANDYVAED